VDVSWTIWRRIFNPLNTRSHLRWSSNSSEKRLSRLYREMIFGSKSQVRRNFGLSDLSFLAFFLSKKSIWLMKSRPHFPSFPKLDLNPSKVLSLNSCGFHWNSARYSRCRDEAKSFPSWYKSSFLIPASKWTFVLVNASEESSSVYWEVRLNSSDLGRFKCHFPSRESPLWLLWWIGNGISLSMVWFIFVVKIEVWRTFVCLWARKPLEASCLVN